MMKYFFCQNCSSLSDKQNDVICCVILVHALHKYYVKLDVNDCVKFVCECDSLFCQAVSESAHHSKHSGGTLPHGGVSGRPGSS